MEQQRRTTQPLTVEQYRQQLIELGRRGGQQIRNAQNTPRIADIHITPQQQEASDSRLEEAGQTIEEWLERAEPLVERAGPFIDLALRSGLGAAAEAGVSAVAEGIRLGMSAIEELGEARREAETGENDLPLSGATSIILPRQPEPPPPSPTLAIQRSAAAQPPSPVQPERPQTQPTQIPIPIPLALAVELAQSASPEAQAQADDLTATGFPAADQTAANLPPIGLTEARARSQTFAQSCAPKPLDVEPQRSKIRPCPVHGYSRRVTGRCRRCGYPIACPAICCADCCDVPAEASSGPLFPEGTGTPAAETPSPFSGVELADLTPANLLTDYPFTAADGSIPIPLMPIPQPVQPSSAVTATTQSGQSSGYTRTERPDAPPDVAYAPLNRLYGVYSSSFDATEYTALPQEHFTTLEELLAHHTGRGQLTVRAFNPDGSPMPGARVRVTAAINGVPYLFYDVLTDHNGEAARMSLPAPAKRLSLSPARNGLPYAFYDVSVTGAGGASVLFHNVTLFSDTESVQDAHFTHTTETRVIDESFFVGQ